MNWINDLLWGEGIGHSILLLSFVIAAGIQLGKIKVFGVSLGITLVLFVGIILGHFGFTINHNLSPDVACRRPVVCGDHFRTFRFYDQPQRDSLF